jgi:hypothetical protein
MKIFVFGISLIRQVAGTENPWSYTIEDKTIKTRGGFFQRSYGKVQILYSGTSCTLEHKKAITRGETYQPQTITWSRLF